MPQPVHDNPGREGVVLPHNVLCQLPTPTAGLGVSSTPEHFKKTSLYRISLLFVITPIQKRLVPRLAIHHPWNARWISDLRFQPAIFFHEGFQFYRKLRYLTGQETPVHHRVQQKGLSVGYLQVSPTIQSIYQ